MATTTATDDLHIHVASKQFDHAQAANGSLQVLQDIDMQVHAGEFISIVGASGCGKSTLLRLVLGIDVDYEGHIALGDERITAPGLDRGIVFQDHRLFPWLTVEQNIAVGLRNADRSLAEKRELIAEHVALVGLQGFESPFRARSRAEWPSAWPLRAAWSTARACCCSTNPSARSMRSRERDCRASCNVSGSTSASPCCW